MEVGGKPLEVCVRTRPELQVFPFDEWRDIRRDNVENRWNVFSGTCCLERVFWNVFLRSMERNGSCTLSYCHEMCHEMFHDIP